MEILKMDEIYKELEETRSTIGSLMKELQSKSRLADNLKQAHDTHLSKIQESNAEIAKQRKEIDAKNQEIDAAKGMHQELQSSLCDKESALKRLGLSNESLKRSYTEEVERLEGENRCVVSALEESNAKSAEYARKVVICNKEIERLNGLLSASQVKLRDAEGRARARSELAQRDEMLVELAREKGELEDRLKWKTEQFRHLEEAHEKIREELLKREREWDADRANLVDEACSLRARLDSETRVAEDLRSRLRMCSQALAHEESRRKLLEVQISESKALYENVVCEFEEARLSIASLTAKRDEEIGSLRNSLATKATVVKEMGFKNAHLKEENRELRSSLKEIRDERINGGKSASCLKSLHQKFKSLEQVHRGCAEKLKAKEVEWTAETEKLVKELEECLFKLACKGEQMMKLQNELQRSNLLLVQQKLEYEEMFVVQMLLRSKLSEFSTNTEKTEIETKQSDTQVEERDSLLMNQLEKRNCDLVQAQAEIKQERELVNSLQERLEHLESIQEEYFLMQKEIELHKADMDGMSRKCDQLKEEAARKESDLREVARKTFDDLDRANSTIAQKNSELDKVEFELQQLKAVAKMMEIVKDDLEIELKRCNDENQSLQRDLENSLLAKMEVKRALEDAKANLLQTIEEKDMKMTDLQHHLARLDEEKQELKSCTLAKLEFEKHYENEKKKFLQLVDNMDRTKLSVQAEIDLLRQNYVMREFETLLRLMEDQEIYLQGMEEKKNVIAEMQEKYLAHEHYFTRSIEICTKNEALEKMISTYLIDHQEIQYRNLLISKLEEELSALEEELAALQMKMEFEEELSYGLRNSVLELEAKSLEESLEKEKEKIRLEDEIKILLSTKKALEVRGEELEVDKKAIHDMVVQLASERENWAKDIMELDDLIGKVSEEGKEVMRNWKMVVSSNTDSNDISMEYELEDLQNSGKEDWITCNSSSKCKTGQTPDKRLPLKEHNCYSL